MNLLCKIIGHRFVMRLRHEYDGIRAQSVVRFTHCTRCGEPWIPMDDLMALPDSWEHAPVADMMMDRCADTGKEGRPTPSRPENSNSKGDDGVACQEESEKGL